MESIVAKPTCMNQVWKNATLSPVTISDIASHQDEIRKNRFDYVPDDANPGSIAYREDCINPAEKYAKACGLNGREKGNFGLICNLGCDQIIACYKYEDKHLDPMEIFRMCEGCKYRNKAVGTHFDKWGSTHRIDEYNSSIWAPYFIMQSKYSDLIARYGEHKDNSYVYFITDGHFVKIGKADNPIKRISGIQVGCPYEIRTIAIVPCISSSASTQVEGWLHTVYEGYSVRGEWFDIYDKLILAKWEHEFPTDHILYNYYDMNEKEA